MYLFNTYNTAKKRSFTSAYLELSNGIFHRQERMEPTIEIAKTYRILMQYVKGFNDYLSGPSIDLKSFQNLYGLLYFDLLTHQEEELKSGYTKLELKYV